MPGIDPTADPRGIGGVAAGWKPGDTGERVRPLKTGEYSLGELAHQELPAMTMGFWDPKTEGVMPVDPTQLGVNTFMAGIRGLGSWGMGLIHPNATRQQKDAAASALQSAVSFPEGEAVLATEEEVANALKNPLVSFEHEHGEGAYSPSFVHIERSESGKNVPVVSKDARTSLAHVRPHPGYIYKGMSKEEYEAFQQTGTINHSSYHTTPTAAERAANHDAPSQFKPSQGRPAYVITVKRPPASDIVGERGEGVELGRPMHADEIVGIHQGDPILQEPGWEEKGATLHWRPIKARHQFSMEEPAFPPDEGMADEEYPHLHVEKEPGFFGKSQPIIGMSVTNINNEQAEESEYRKRRAAVK